MLRFSGAASPVAVARDLSCSRCATAVSTTPRVSLSTGSGWIRGSVLRMYSTVLLNLSSSWAVGVLFRSAMMASRAPAPFSMVPSGFR